MCFSKGSREFPFQTSLLPANLCKGSARLRPKGKISMRTHDARIVSEIPCHSGKVLPEKIRQIILPPNKPL